ncbi:putative glycosyltransferase EpsJ [Pedobacter glucosidilyticus]|nr:glycosyltransferase family A protein [Pedobacter glucosidilyticus]KHJ39624.1 putative glycosyltransferase EpsJ [Pedobacter glucosidilyticus]
MNDLISVIIPCYNSEKWIIACLESVINQTYKNLEIIVVDDGSTDNTAKEINAIQDNRIKYYFKQNGGLSSARNFGIKKALGEWIAFLDSDDSWEENKISIQLSESKNYDAIYCDFHNIDIYDEIIKEDHNFNPASFNFDFKKAILSNNKIPGGSSMLIKKQVITNIGFFNEKLTLGEDWEYWARLIWNDYKLKFIDKKLTKIRKHFDSMQKTSSESSWHNSLELILTKFLTFENITNKEKSIVYKKFAMISYRFNSSFFEYIKYYKLAIQNNWVMAVDKQLLELIIKFSIKKIFLFK